MNPLRRVFDLYKKDFGFEDNRLIQLFEELLSKSPCSILECAPQITPKGIHAARFRVGYVKEDIPEGIKAVFQFIDKISESNYVLLNRTILEQIVDNRFKLSRISKLGIGIDYRENINDSKVKCYFVVKDYPEKLDQVMAIHPPVDKIDDYPHNNMFGINMYFDGRTDIEIYPSLMSKDLRDSVLMEKFKLQDVSHRFLEGCNTLFVSFEGHGRRVLHFYPQSPTIFVRIIGNRQLSMLYGNAQIRNHLINRSKKIGPLRVVISLLKDEIISKNIQHINLALYHQFSQETKR